MMILIGKKDKIVKVPIYLYIDALQSETYNYNLVHKIINSSYYQN